MRMRIIDIIMHTRVRHDEIQEMMLGDILC